MFPEEGLASLTVMFAALRMFTELLLYKIQHTGHVPTTDGTDFPLGIGNAPASMRTLVRKNRGLESLLDQGTNQGTGFPSVVGGCSLSFYRPANSISTFRVNSSAPLRSLNTVLTNGTLTPFDTQKFHLTGGDPSPFAKRIEHRVVRRRNIHS